MNGLSLTQLAAQIERERDAKRDFTAPAKRMKMILDTDGEGSVPFPMLHLDNGNGGLDLTIGQTAHDQLAEKVGIPAKYYQRMQADAPELLAENVNEWLHRSEAKHLVRTLDGSARAVLSDRYRPLDNDALAEAVLPLIAENRWTVHTCDLTERRLTIKMIDFSRQEVIVRPHGQQVCHPGLTIMNSEIGMSAVRIGPSLHHPHCGNLVIFDEASTSSFHLGRKDVRFGDVAGEFFKDDTRRADDVAFWKKVRDTVQAVTDAGLFDMMVARLKATCAQVITADVVEVTERLGKQYGVAETERKSILRHLIEGGDLTQYGLQAAITRAAQDVPEYDRQTDLEKLGGRVIELPRESWKVLAAA